MGEKWGLPRPQPRSAPAYSSLYSSNKVIKDMIIHAIQWGAKPRLWGVIAPRPAPTATECVAVIQPRRRVACRDHRGRSDDNMPAHVVRPLQSICSRRIGQRASLLRPARVT